METSASFEARSAPSSYPTRMLGYSPFTELRAPLGRALYVLLSNSLCIGEIRCRGVRHPGQYQPIVDRGYGRGRSSGCASTRCSVAR